MAIQTVPFSDLLSADLVVDREYEGGNARSSAGDPLSPLLGVGNMGGFRIKGSQKKNDVRLAVLYSSGAEAEWPDRLDAFSGTYTYFGDNRTPGNSLHDTPRLGNQLLATVFERASSSADARAKVPPFFVFRRAGAGRSVKFLGLAAPGSPNVPPGDDLVAVWRSVRGERFQNYKATFTILDEACIPREWISEVLAGTFLGKSCPAAWKRWVADRKYLPLISEQMDIRTPQEQEPASPQGKAVLEEIRRFFNEELKNPALFEQCAVAIWRLIAPATGQVDLTRPWRDGGVDAVGTYTLGPAQDALAVEFSLEAKCWKNAVGVKEVARLIARLRHRQFGVFVTTSVFNKQAYTEVRSDKHPVVLVAGADIVAALNGIGVSDVESVRQWLHNEFPAGM